VRVGESLDWSAPQLFGQLDLNHDALIDDQIGTYKREVHGFTSQGDRLVGGPPHWLERWPMRFESVTVHVDRERFDQRLFDAALDAGVEFVWERVRTVHMAGDRISDCVTSSGRCYRARWYIDASGRSRIVGRTARIATQRWGCERIGLWRHRRSGVTFDGTALHFDDASPDLVWAWEIPIGVERTSVGVVMPVTDFRDARREAESLDEVMDHALVRFSSLDADSLAGPTRTRTFQPYVSQRIVGTNWLMVGEAAALVDPLSSSGVTAAIRHGVEAAATIVSAERTPESRGRLLARYDRRVSDVARLYNEALERLLYDPRLRTRLSMRQAARAYVILGYLVSALYNRIEPAESMARQTTMTLTVNFFHLWIRLWRITSLTAKPSRP
jgi:flavin-dependent dehydrogenase